jgi:hypothetical protein
MMQSNDDSKWLSMLESMTLKQLYRLFEMTHLRQSIGQGEETNPTPWFADEHSDSVHSIRSKERGAINAQVWKRIQNISARVFHDDAPHCGSYSKHTGFGGFIVMWDPWQDYFKDRICHESTRPAELEPSPAFEKQYLWDDSSDDEKQV